MSGWYYCPKCGKGFKGPEAMVRKTRLPGIVEYCCDECGIALYVSGKQLILVAFIGWMICMVFFDSPEAETYGLIWFGAMMAMGLLRIQKQWTTWSAEFHRKAAQATPDDNSETPDPPERSASDPASDEERDGSKDAAVDEA